MRGNIEERMPHTKPKTAPQRFLLAGRRFSQRLNAISRRLYLHTWFPHLPLAVAVAILGIIHLVHVPLHNIGWDLLTKDVETAANQMMAFDMTGLPQAVPALILIVMSVGILLRSQFAWIITVIFLCISIAIDLLTHSGHNRAALITSDILLLVPLVFYRHVFQKRSIASTTIFAVTSLILLMGYAVLVALKLGDQFEPHITTLTTAFYFAVETMSTVGYGDIAPITEKARLFVVSIIVLGITVFATTLSTIVLPIFNNHLRRLLQRGKQTMERSNHFIIVGDSALARNSYKIFRTKGQQVSMILATAPEHSMFDNDDIIVGDGSDTDVLKNACADRAAAVMALGNDDAENAFVILAAKELEGGHKTVISVSDSKNLNRVRRVKPDLVISPQILGGEVLALALLGDKIDSDALMKNLFQRLKK